MTMDEGWKPQSGGPLKYPEKLQPRVPIVGFIDCARLHGKSVRQCACMIPNEGGWHECPPEARGTLAPAERAAERKEWTARLSPVQLATVFTRPDVAASYPIPPPLVTDIDLEPKTPDQIRAAVSAERRQFSASFPSGKSAGFTGSICGHCGSGRMIRNGSCETCLDCYQSGECG